MRSFLLVLWMALAAHSGALASVLNISDSGPADMASMPWRCSLDGKVYRVQLDDGMLAIAPVQSGQISATLKIHTGKKGKHKVSGQWQSDSGKGYALLERVSDGHLSGYFLMPVAEDAGNSCTSWAAAIIANLAAANENKVICRRVEVAWEREDTFSFAQAAQNEPLQQANLVPVAAFAAQEADNSSLVGTWVFEDAGSMHYTHIEITLRGDGTYTKTLGARTPGWGGGGQVGAPSLGGTHSGTWTSSGTVVHLSGDGHWPPYDHDLRSFRKVR